MCSSTMNDMQLFILTGRTFTHITSSSSWHICILPKLWLVWGTYLPQATTSIGPATSHAQNVFYYTKWLPVVWGMTPWGPSRFLALRVLPLLEGSYQSFFQIQLPDYDVSASNFTRIGMQVLVDSDINAF